MISISGIRGLLLVLMFCISGISGLVVVVVFSMCVALVVFVFSMRVLARALRTQGKIAASAALQALRTQE